MPHPSLALEGVTQVLADGRILFSDLHETFDARPTALVGRNGVGKSMLAAILAGHVAPTSGRCVRHGRVHYLPQQVVPASRDRVADLAGVGEVLAALARVESGSCDAADFERVTIPASARQMLMGGVTSVRDMAAPADAIFGVKKRIASGELAGSTIYAAGPALAKMAPGAAAPTSQFLPIADAADARAKTRQLLDQGADVIKMFFTERMSPEERSAIITEPRLAPPESTTTRSVAAALTGCPWCSAIRGLRAGSPAAARARTP